MTLRTRVSVSNQAQVLRRIRGNARTMLLLEPMFCIPFGLIAAYATLYMKALGLTPWQIGLISSAGAASAVVWSVLGGPITDRFGRRRSLIVSDLVGWTLAISIWAVSQNFWYFLAAALLNGVGNIAATAWTCLLVEDSEPEARVSIFTVLQAIAIMSGFFVPLAGVAVRYWGLIPATRGMYVFFLVSLTSMLFIRHAGTRESSVGRGRITETEHHSWQEALKDYLSSSSRLMSNQVAFALLVVNALLAIRDALAYTFSSIYINEQLGVPVAWMAAFPTLSSVVQLCVLAVGMSLSKVLPERRALWVGLSLSGLSLILLVTAPRGGYAFLVASTLSSAGAGALVVPALSAAWNNSLDDGDRATLNSVLLFITSIVRLPMGWIAGIMYGASPRLPFASAIVLTALALAAVLKAFKRTRTRTADASAGCSLP